MLSFLDMINHWLGYFNINAKLKNRIYIIIAFLGDLYLIYVTTRLLINHAWVRGLLYCLAVILITYCLYINAVYYYLDRNSRFDFLSPWLSKITGVVPTADVLFYTALSDQSTNTGSLFRLSVATDFTVES